MNNNKQQIQWEVNGITCSGCAETISTFLKNENMEQVHVNVATHEVRFINNPKKEIDFIVKGLHDLGYDVVGSNGSKKPFFTLERKLLASTFFTVPLFLHMFLPFAWLHNTYVQLFFCVPVFVLGWLHFGRGAWGSVKLKKPNMDVLILIGASAAFIYSLLGTMLDLGINYLFYETSATIITLVMVGNWIESKSIKRTADAIENLKDLKSDKSQVVIDVNGFAMTDWVKTSTVKIDDIILINEGESVPLDAEIISGFATIDESMITGESIPVNKSIGENIISGTVLISGNIKARVYALESDSYLNRLIQLVKNAASEKPHVQKFSDKVSYVFVPVILAIALLTLVLNYYLTQIGFTQALLNCIAVLAIACPCAMGLATPTAIMVGLGELAKKGIVIKGAKTVESWAGIKTIVFDKTGTLTQGDFEIQRFSVFNEQDETQVKSIIFYLEQHTSHPIAKSIVRHWKQEELTTFFLEHIKEIKGKGMEASDKEGNYYFFGVPDKNISHQEFDLLLYKNKIPIAGVDIADAIKPGAEEVIKFFQKEAINVVMMSGDSEKKCKSVAEKLQITNYFFAMKPEEKLEKIKQFNAIQPTAMVGDGINDAPALAQATVGISLGNASAIAMDNAQIILLKSDLYSLQESYVIGKTIFKTIKQNLFWALSYNLIAIPIAAFGFLNPMIAALSMAFSDVVVIGNSLLLRWKKLN